ncbi:unnamed protein product [Soboliphyme baturini]|uniref:N-alpha-acetyltransferase 60 n=1 Tax=Soboliphyme baturini TaxID=241478 RepID=A0A183IK28_9BILA|nr:unnamed protein product [Soboliphyme baturini]
MVVTHEEKIIGVLVAEIKKLSQCNLEDQNILPKSYPANTAVCYMLSLGVHKDWRRRGIASKLLNNLLTYLENGASAGFEPTRCLFLHVLVENENAINFYERHSRLKSYYKIDDKYYDGFTYVYYLNGTIPPWSLRYELFHKKHL